MTDTPIPPEALEASKDEQFQQYARRMEADMNDLGAEINRLKARIRELEGALEPFALAANNFDNYGRAIADPKQWFAYGGTVCPDGQIGAISVADLRAARAIYKGETNGN